MLLGHPPPPQSVAKARALTRRTLTEWGMIPLLDAAELVVSELVTNAVRYGAAPVVLMLGVISPGALAGSVAAGGPGLPRLPPDEPDLDATGGRGLAIVRDLVTRWGVWPDSGGIGRTVWFTLTAENES
ncbi:ATP-binding protein [Sphaerisporangium sp. B11E5]|uniref:ATP-binding protein n=1 Tax=Sphaerisporangium sp. B11E5 TaxID=3153563 RepID=UPI00325CCC34